MDGSRQFCTVDGHRLAYRRVGPTRGSPTRGDPVLLVHGITTWSFLWDEVIGTIAEEHEVIALDLLGCGYSDKPLDASYSLRSHADRLVRFLDALGVQAVHYVGHDLGGGIGQVFAVRNPARTRTLALINSVAYDFWPVQPIIALRTPVIRQLLLATFDAGTFRLVIRRGLFHKERLTPAVMERFQEPLQTEAGRKGFLHFARCLDNSDLTSLSEDLRRLPVPTTVIWGMADVYLSFAIAEKLVANIPGAKLIKLEHSGHFSPLDEPGRVAPAILESLRARQP